MARIRITSLIKNPFLPSITTTTATFTIEILPSIRLPPYYPPHSQLGEKAQSPSRPLLKTIKQMLNCHSKGWFLFLILFSSSEGKDWIGTLNGYDNKQRRLKSASKPTPCVFSIAAVILFAFCLNLKVFSFIIY